FQAEDGIRGFHVTGVQTCALPIYRLQEAEFRKANAGLLDRNKRRIADLVETGKVRKRDRDDRPAAGTVLTREYKGVEYRVVSMRSEERRVGEERGGRWGAWADVRV